MKTANTRHSLNTAQASPPGAICTTTAGGVFEAPLGGGLVSFSANALPGEKPAALLERLLSECVRRKLVAVQGNVFSDPALAEAVSVDFPISWTGRHDTPEGDLRSARVLALPEGSFERVEDSLGIRNGVLWETSDNRYLLLGALIPENPDASAFAQVDLIWRRLKATLEKSKFALTDLVRTWFFNDHILDWYDDFNAARTAFFNENNVFGSLVPASTGVGTSNALGALFTLDVLAVAPRTEKVSAIMVPSPLQCPANDYKSAFSRAVEVAGDEGRHLLVSGTAGIEPEGQTAHLGDLDRQIDLALRVVAAILESRGMDWRNVSRAILYFPDVSWMPHYEARRVALGLPDIPAIYAHCDVCRGDLLFEIELDAFSFA
ncbi:MAG: hypothetical protein LBV54_00045 [Puniceicoccales bacterium]|jgi:enamine deaminase RidA (YjgF/YER057c/UK114 family)|nr:hypothetical protein [Puniceicoccales bacterium]